MSMKSLLGAIVTGTLGIVVGFLIGNLTAEPPRPGAGRPLTLDGAPSDSFDRPRFGEATEQGDGAFGAKTIDAADLASALGQQFEVNLLHERLAEAVREEVRTVLEDELSRVLSRSDSLAAGVRSSPTPSQDELEAQAQALARAQSTLEAVRARGRFDPQSRDELKELLPSISPDAQYELSLQLSVAINQGEVQIDDPNEVPFF